MSISALTERVFLAQNFVEEYQRKGGYWFLIGKTTPWVNSQPPVPPSNAGRVPELYAAVYVHNCQLVIPHPNGDIGSGPSKFKLYESEDDPWEAAYFGRLSKAAYAYLEADILKDTFAEDFTYGCVGLASNLELITPLTSREQGTVIYARDINRYRLLWVDYFEHRTVLRTKNTRLELVRKM